MQVHMFAQEALLPSEPSPKIHFTVFKLFSDVLAQNNIYITHTVLPFSMVHTKDSLTFFAVCS